jgi:hypothetical protein
VLKPEGRAHGGKLRIPHPAYNEQKLESIKAEMRKVGPPTIRVVRYSGYYMAIEGCHRLTAAAELGFIPVLVVLAETDFVEAASLDSDYFGDKEFVRAGEAAEAFYSEFNPVLVVNSDGTLSLPAHPTEEP